MRQIPRACALSSALAQLATAEAQAISSFAADFSSTVNTDSSVWSCRHADQNRGGNDLLLPILGHSIGASAPTSISRVREKGTAYETAQTKRLHAY